MKLVVTLCVILSALCTSVSAQELPLNHTTNKVSYTDVVIADGESKAKLLAKAKKWIVSKNTEQNPYLISLENEQEGTIVGKGNFPLPGDRRKYTVQFAISIATKDGKCKYEFTDLVIKFRTNAGSSGGGWGGYGGSTHREAETLENSLETFYPSRLESKKPVIAWYEEIRRSAFEAIDREMQSIGASLKQSITAKEDW